jgi:ubiquinone biosynthesis accessory factor UbiK
MFDAKFFDEMSKRLTDVIPENVKMLRSDIEKQFRLVLQTMFAKLDLVTREEFDVQALVLSKTRGKLEKLEQRVIELEKQHAKKFTKSKT